MPMKSTMIVVLRRGLALLLALPLAVSAAAPGAKPAAESALPDELGATLQILRAERDGLWEKTLVVRFAGERRVLSTSDGLLDARAAINHAAHPRLWARLGTAGKRYSEGVRDATADRLGLPRSAVARMGTAADMDNLAVVTRRHGPLTVTVLATAGARNNAQRTGVDAGTYIEEEAPAGTINIMVLSNIALSDAALARALITVTEGKTAALEDLRVPSSYTPGAQATGTGTDSIIMVSGTAAPRATYTGGHSRIGELIGKATYQAVVEALGRQDGVFLPGSKRFAEASTAPAGPAKAAGDLRLALLHLDAVPGDIAGNRARIEDAIREAVRHGADWIVTPELAETGYHFAKRIGTDWIASFPDAWIGTLAAIARDNRVALFVGVAERDAASGRLHNSVAAIDRDGTILGTYRKQRVHGGAESWSQAGDGGRPPFVVDGLAVGTLICADTWAAEPAARQAAQGAAILLTPANWPPVAGMGPGDAWERRTRETGIPMIVVNRGGSEPELDFSRGESAVSLNGERLLSFEAERGGIFYVDWDRRQRFREVRPE
ncbi:adenosylcobinamide amidohydrolase [Azospira restricta]|uniref:Adenosylcobinamide amidohydrolase n=1 Tax=Azospira restricta TaxID=404405 RepID=A0A974PX14_9RHOO|nr:adenosylcobinamide amidohydrolase [Azospira restricta]QRJ63058.1 adenosylcobinamide amidohydrolase [Azospira restricta]